MSDPRNVRDERRLIAVLVVAAVSWLADPAGAQVCVPDLPDPATAFQPAGPQSKFRLIEARCPALAASTLPPAPANPLPPVDVRVIPGPDREADGGPGGATPNGLPGGAWSPAANVRPVAFATPVAAPAVIPLAGDGEDRAVAPVRDPRARRVLALAAPVIRIARENGLDPLLLHAIAHVESRHDPAAVSPAGARGLMQVMPATGRRFGAGSEDALFDADTNLRASAAYLRTLKLRYHDDLKLVLAAYNAGEGAVDKAGGNIPPYPETQEYVRRVLSAYNRLSESFEVGPGGRLQRTADAGSAR